MAVCSISCSLRPPAPVREASARLTTQPNTTTATAWADVLRRACVAAAAAASCVVIGAAGDVAAASSTTTPRDVVGVAARARWSDRRECPPWRANSLENVVPENLPRPSARRRFSTVKRAPALGPRAVAPPLLAPPYGVDEYCFTL